MDKYTKRARRAHKARARIKQLGEIRLCVFRSNNHIYAQIIDASGGVILSQASTLESKIRKSLGISFIFIKISFANYEIGRASCRERV